MGSQYGKVLKTVSFDADHGVTVSFEDGTMASGSNLVGADGAKSPTRTILLGREKAAIQPTAVPHDQPYYKVYGRTSYVCVQTSLDHGVLDPS
jgi:2-polyprenyl-6-methoxyphenol hydroxylase-like FAD-dependent oxidoreductase